MDIAGFLANPGSFRMCVLGSLGRRINSFFRQDTGAVTVEGVLWVPIYGVFFALLVDVSLMFNG
ncbi:hypothetical protein, partial [Silicimonas algicola]|uniref:hypothetical protein n=1 Tax=Silicimonas algicola TaxID=1826607 RepID=UPI001B85F5BF